MKFTVEVTPGSYTTEAQLDQAANWIAVSLNLAVGDVAANVFPEYKFSEVTPEGWDA